MIRFKVRDVCVKELSFLLSVPILVVVCIGAVGCEQDGGGQEKPMTDEKPLLLPDEPDIPVVEGPMADNSRCHVCHINYADESLAVVHARANIGCEQCHGASDAHCNDEDNITPPQIMYPVAKIVGFCMGCHTRETIEIEPHKALLAGTEAEKKYCTDCHGQHRLGYRTRRWDKQTGELIEDDKVRMMTDPGLPRPDK